MGNPAKLQETLKGFEAVFLVVPGHHDRTQLALNGIEAGKHAGVKFLLVLSVLTVGTNTIFGRQFDPIEAKTKESGIHYCIIRLPLFMDNNYAHLNPIKEESIIYDPRDPTKLSTPVAIADIGKVAAEILANPEDHVGMTYKLVAPTFSFNDKAAEFTKALGKEVKVKRVSYEEGEAAMLKQGLPEWQADGIMKLYKFIDADSPLTNEADIADIGKITGEKSTTIEDWVALNAAAFK